LRDGVYIKIDELSLVVFGSGLSTLRPENNF